VIWYKGSQELYQEDPADLQRNRITQVEIDLYPSLPVTIVTRVMSLVLGPTMFYNQLRSIDNCHSSSGAGCRSYLPYIIQSFVGFRERLPEIYGNATSSLKQCHRKTPMILLTIG
jgi:hypothetical protein